MCLPVHYGLRVEITFLPEANISLSYIVRKYLQSVLRAKFNWSFEFHLHPAFSLLELQLFCDFACIWLCSTSTIIYIESELDQTCSPKLFI